MTNIKDEENQSVAGVASKKRAKMKKISKIYNPRILLVKKELDNLFDSVLLSQLANMIDLSLDDKAVFTPAQFNQLLSLKRLLDESVKKIDSKVNKMTTKTTNVMALRTKFGMPSESLSKKSGTKK